MGSGVCPRDGEARRIFSERPNGGRMRRRIGILLAAAVGATWLLAAPASADDTTVTFTVTTGAIDISAPTGPVALTNGTLTPGGTASGQIGTVDVTDARGVTPASWTPPCCRRLVGPRFRPSPRPPLPTRPDPSPRPARASAQLRSGVRSPRRRRRPARSVTPAAGGGNTCSWDPTISVAIPVTAATVTYTAIVQHLVVGL